MNGRDFEQAQNPDEKHLVTPLHIIELLRHIFIKAGEGDWLESVLDPACGSSKFLSDSLGTPLPSSDAQRRVEREVEAFISELASQDLPHGITSKQVAPRNSNEPPRLGEKLLLLLLTREERRANIVGDLAEEYAQILAKHGARFGRIWYWKQVLTSFGPILRRALRWGFLLGMGEWIRKHIL